MQKLFNFIILNMNYFSCFSSISKTTRNLDAVQSLQQLHFSMFSTSECTCCQLQVFHCFTAACFSIHTMPTFNMANAKFNTLKLWLLLQSPSGRAGYASVETSCRLKKGGASKRVCACLGGGQEEPFTKADIQLYLCSVWQGFWDLSLPRVHHNYPFKYFQLNKPHRAGLK